LEITPETLRTKAQACRDRAEALRDEQKRLLAEAYGLDREAQALADAERLRAMTCPPPSARAVLAGEIAAYLARCRKPKSSGEIAAHFTVSSGRARQALELLTEIGMAYRSGLKRGTRYRILRDGEDPPDEPQPFGDRWHEYVRDVALRLETFTTAEIVSAIPEVAPATIHRWLGKLVEDGVLTRERVGKGWLYAYEPPQAPALRSVAPVETRRRDRAVAGTGKSKVSRREVAEVLRVAKAAGAEIKPQKHGYAVLIDGEVVNAVPRTPSDHRSLKNARQALKRNGVRA
jgi:DNA-binding transcriptional ArsR family regulator